MAVLESLTAESERIRQNVYEAFMCSAKLLCNSLRAGGSHDNQPLRLPEGPKGCLSINCV